MDAVLQGSVRESGGVGGGVIGGFFRSIIMGITLSSAFAHFGAEPRNIQSSVSAYTPEGVLVISLWQQYFSRSDLGPVYIDRLSRWPDRIGNKWLQQDLEQAKQINAPIRAIIVIASDPALVDAGGDASKMKKEFFIPRWESGLLSKYDGDEFEIQFPSSKPS